MTARYILTLLHFNSLFRFVKTEHNMQSMMQYT